MAPSTRTGSRTCNRECTLMKINATAATAANGFTLVELLIVISLISILAAMGLVQYKNSVISHARSRCSRPISSACATRSTSTMPTRASTRASLDALVSDGYMRKIPEDPFTKSADSWQTVPAEARSQQPERRARHLQREERRARHGSGRDELFGLVGGRSSHVLRPWSFVLSPGSPVLGFEFPFRSESVRPEVRHLADSGRGIYCHGFTTTAVWPSPLGPAAWRTRTVMILVPVAV